MEDTNVMRVAVQPEITGPNAPEKPQTQPQGQPASKPEAKPEWLPEKFWKEGKADFEGLAKSYGELEKAKPAQPKAGDPPAQPTGEQTPKAGEQPPKASEQAQQTNIPGITQEQSTKYWGELNSTGGKLSDASYAELAKAGYPRELVDNYIAGVTAKHAQAKTAADATIADVKGTVGGEQAYQAMIDWAGANLSESEIAEFNEAVSSGKLSIMKLAVAGLNDKFSQANGTEPNLLSGRGNDAYTGDVFKSQAEITRAMRDPRYKQDPAYRKEVEQKIARSSAI
ncbi:MAG: hypothetical protein A4E20_01420 [Nitrospira sp. SG-bin2]|uniref:capsid assembly protein n=1 Tax=Nitrospira cf. moscoviensis SBR1015 TaxID=96242 RepID=UPI000A0D79A8|nr:hypothetical protein [Nitrospira cf. moscoviensis SBR1015]OQW34864.1 MAG: hypothetical protein A4E20_01420 [Nitrospira sp. SG-bin2]